MIEDRHLGSDYAVAIIGASLVERALEVAIVARFVPLDKDNRKRMFSYEQKGPLADLGARNRMGFALGLYGEPTFKDLEKIREIRNLFAHSASLHKFSDRPVAEACAKFSALDHVFRGTSDPPGHRETPQGAYVSVCLQIAGRLRARLERKGRPSFPFKDGALP